ncbi:unnamed protein product [Soboliphyme baturini]|uniref:CX domain-containing protein n=1 Tax=Soboliphyme baturini TaxID=241478 RepID=A0A183IDW0_9BILA|nr:unnamed protein product [Soboliphyme baturini]
MADNSPRSRWDNFDEWAAHASTGQAASFPPNPVYDQYISSTTTSDASEYITCNGFLCRRELGCCEQGCCSGEALGMVYGLIAFVIVVAVIGAAIAVICYQRSRSKAKKDALYESYARSQLTPYPYYGYDNDRASRIGPLY